MGPKCPGAEMSRGRNVWGPKRPGAETSLGPKRPRAETSLGPKRPGAKMSFGPKRPGAEMSLGPKHSGRNVLCRNSSGRNLMKPYYSSKFLRPVAANLELMVNSHRMNRANTLET